MQSRELEIIRVTGFEVLDSRGNFTIRVCVSTGIASECADAPSGASKGGAEARELHEGEAPKRVHRAVSLVNSLIAQALVGVDAREQAKIDSMLEELDGTEDFSKIGGNTAIATSVAVAKTAAKSLGLEPFQYIGGVKRPLLPAPLMNFINGGLHGAGYLDIQEFLIAPVGFASFKEALVEAVRVYHELKKTLISKFGKSSVMLGDEGGFSPPLRSSEEALEYLVRAVEATGHGVGGEFFLGIDAAASNLYDRRVNGYRLEGRVLSPSELIDYYVELAGKYKLIYIEDPFLESDYDSFASLQSSLGRTAVVGDDLYATRVSRLREGCKRKSTKGVIVKPNQVGTLTRALEFAHLAGECGNIRVVSHRSGDTEDSFIADLAVGVSAHFIKTGAPARGERTSKYNRLLYLESSYGLGFIGSGVLEKL